MPPSRPFPPAISRHRRRTAASSSPAIGDVPFRRRRHMSLDAASRQFASIQTAIATLLTRRCNRR
jgi:hypothetical protein